MKLLAKFNLILIVVFGLGGVAIAKFSYSFLMGNARREVLAQAQLMMASAKAVRDYTADDLSPLLQQNPRHKVHFLAETIPFYGATTTFNALRKSYPDYTYKEAALNPTNLEDRAADWEADVIRGFRDHPETKQIINEREAESGRSLYIANPIVVGRGCLECHSVPKAAPAAMINVYGEANGFGWKPNEIVGAQIISVPMAVPIAIANEAYQRLLIFLIATMLIAIAALDLGVYLLVVRPLGIVSDRADRVSKGEKDVDPLVVKGKDEIAKVTSSFNRMQLSLAKAFKMIEEA